MHPIDRHEKVVLQFSGGKDSIACLLLLKPWWHKITVVWVNSGDAFPETIAQMKDVRAMVPNFLEVKSNQPRQIANNGYPVDVLPIRASSYGKRVEPNDLPLMQAYANCCDQNLWFPMQQACKELGVTLIIRGTRLSDSKKAKCRSGDIVDGVEYFFPIENMSDHDVLEFVSDSSLLPRNYPQMKTSLDCKMCTAYLCDNKEKLPYLRQYHPKIYAELTGRITEIKHAVKTELAYIEGVL